MKEACGVFGVWAPSGHVARTAFFALCALQHRGQESAGIATWDGSRAHLHRGLGLVHEVFEPATLAPLEGASGIGHTRYSTMGGPGIQNSQPFLVHTPQGPLAVAHNGNLTNARRLRKALLERGTQLSSDADSELLLHLIARPLVPAADTWIARLQALLQTAQGAYCLTVLTADGIYAVRDRHGFRPLCIGTLQDAWVVASESCAIDAIGGRTEREIEPGEIVLLDADGVHSWSSSPERHAFCTFESMYFSRADSQHAGRSVHASRAGLGRRLAIEAPADADIVIGVPESALPAALAYAEASGIPYRQGLIQNRSLGRTFIQPDADERLKRVRRKYTPVRSVVAGNRVVVVDDTLVRGLTARQVVGVLREVGATEVHVRISAPPVRHPCFMGVDLGSHAELLAASRSTEQVRELLGADSLAYLSADSVDQVLGPVGRCVACFDGCYPVAVEDRDGR